jgi:hypothetical protein
MLLSGPFIWPQPRFTHERSLVTAHLRLDRRELRNSAELFGLYDPTPSIPARSPPPESRRDTAAALFRIIFRNKQLG